MKRLFLILVLLAGGLTGFSQDLYLNAYCDRAHPLCNGSSNTFPYFSTMASIEYSTACMDSVAGKLWYYVEVDNPGDIDLHLSRVDSSGTLRDVNFICWGPITNLYTACDGTMFDEVDPGIPVVDCSNSSALEEDCHITGALAGQVYLILTASHDTTAGFITFTQTGGTGSIDCSHECGITGYTTSFSPCAPGSSQYTLSGTISFDHPYDMGYTQITSDCMAFPDQAFVGYLNPTTLFFDAYYMQATGGPCTLYVSFSGHPECDTFFVFTAPDPCFLTCSADAGTFTNTINGNGTTNYVLCYNDNLDIVANGDFVAPDDTWDPAFVYDPGLWLMVYRCPPTVFSPLDLYDPFGVSVDSCYLGIESTADGVWNIANTVGDGSTLYYVPMTVYSMVDGAYSTTNSIRCYGFGDPIPVTFLPEVITTATTDCEDATVTVTVSGGHPQVFGTSFTASNLLPTSAVFNNTTCVNGGTIIISGLANGDLYSFDIVDDNGCPVTFTGGPFVGPATTTINPAGPFCNQDAPVNLTAVIPGGVWSGTGITNPTLGTFDPAIAGNGTWTITYLLPGCAAPTNTSIVVNGPQTNVTDTDITCNGNNDGSIVITGLPTYLYSIDGGINFSSSGVFNGLAPAVYTVVVQSDEGCETTIFVNLNQPLPFEAEVSTLANESCAAACNGQVTANVTGGNLPYNIVWAGPVSGIGITLSNLCAGVYTATITDANNCPVSIESNVANVGVALPTPVTFEVDTILGCSPLTIHFTNTTDPSVVSACNWNFGDEITGNHCYPVHTYNQPGCYDVSLQVQTIHGCTFDTLITGMICVLESPVAEFIFSPEQADVFFPAVTFTNASTGGTGYTWYFEDLGISHEENPVFTFPNNKGSIYKVCLSTINDTGCIDTTCHKVVVDDIFLVYVPNAFTPDGDGRNDVFLPSLQGEAPGTYEFYVFDRWGNIVFQTTDKTQGWDGTFKGAKAKEDVYVWKVLGQKSMNADKLEYTGHVTLLK